MKYCKKPGNEKLVKLAGCMKVSAYILLQHDVCMDFTAVEADHHVCHFKRRSGNWGFVGG